MSYTALIAPYVEATLAEMRRVVSGVDVSPFYQQLHYHLGWTTTENGVTKKTGGKRIRPVFCLMACELFAGSFQRALPAAAAVELLHQFSLIHDDIEDGDETRHHQPTLWKVVGPAQAINAGDGMFALAQLALLRTYELGVPTDRVLRAQKRFNETAVALCLGQYLDMSFETRVAVTPEEYIEMIRGKTAALLAFSVEVGALMGGAEEAEGRKLYALGEAIGLAFQMRDDLLGIWGDPTVTGKPVGADIRAKKKSLPVAFALARDEGGELEALYQGSLDGDEGVGRARALIERTGAREQVEALAETYEAEAMGILESLDVPAARLEPLRKLTDMLAARLR